MSPGANPRASRPEHGTRLLRGSRMAGTVRRTAPWRPPRGCEVGVHVLDVVVLFELFHQLQHLLNRLALDLHGALGRLGDLGRERLDAGLDDRLAFSKSGGRRDGEDASSCCMSSAPASSTGS